MISVDFRTRTDDDVQEVDAKAFFTVDLPGVIERNCALAVPTRAPAISTARGFSAG